MLTRKILPSSRDKEDRKKELQEEQGSWREKMPMLFEVIKNVRHLTGTQKSALKQEITSDRRNIDQTKQNIRLRLKLSHFLNQ